MRVTSVGFYLGLGTLGMIGFAVTSGCGQLWRPFLDPEPAAAVSDLAVADLATTSIPEVENLDLGVLPWTVEPSGTTQTLYGVWGINVTTEVVTPAGDGGVAMVKLINQMPIFAVGAAATMLQRSPKGVWGAPKIDIQGAPNLYAVTGRSPTDVIAVGDGRLVATWDGNLWSESHLVGTSAFLGVAPIAGQSTYLAVGESNAISTVSSSVRKDPGGYGGEKVDLTSIYVSDQSYWIGTAHGDLLKYEAGTYASYGLPVGNAIRSIWARSTTDIWAVGDKGYVLRFDGRKWTTNTTQFPAFKLSLYGITGNSRGELWAVGENGTVMYFDGTEWTRWQHPSLVTLRGVFFEPNTGGLWAVGDKGMILHGQSSGTFGTL